MTNKEAIEVLEQMRSQIANDRKWLALFLAIKALKQIDLIKFNIHALNKLIEEAENETN